MVAVRLDTASITDWKSFHDACRTLFGFPDFYGANMDAWIDCMSYLRDDAGMTRFNLSAEECLSIEVTDAESFKKRLPEIFDALVECMAFVNKRYVENGESPALSIVL